MFVVHRDRRTALLLIDILLQISFVGIHVFLERNRKNMYGYAKFAVSKIRVLKEKGDYLPLAVEPHGRMTRANMYVVLILWAVPGFKKRENPLRC